MTLAALRPAAVCCTGCGNPLPGELYNSGRPLPCDNCGAKLEVEAFPALFRGTGPLKGGEALTVENEASCFYHPHKKAAVLCSACGRFLCTLCETDLAGRCLCPTCIDQGRLTEGIEQLVTQRPLYDSLALSTAVLPMLFFPITVVTAPIAIFLALRYWNRPGSILPRTRFRFVLAIIIALAQVAGWLAVLYFQVL